MAVLTIYSRVSRIAGTAAMGIAMLLLTYMVLHISLEIVLRSLFATSTYSMDEYVGYSVGAMTFLAMADTFRERKHIRVGLLLATLRGLPAMAVEVISILLTFGMTAFLTLFIWRMLARDFQRGSVSPTINETPMWLVDGIIFVGLILFMVQLIASLIDVLQTGHVPETARGD